MDQQQYDQFLAAVEQMRAAQKDFFRTRSKDSLRASKALEARVDSIILQSRAAAAGQGTLTFPET